MKVTYSPNGDGTYSITVHSKSPTDAARLIFLKAALKMHLAGLRMRGGSPVRAAKAMGFEGTAQNILTQVCMLVDALKGQNVEAPAEG